jgi:glutaryl-CoA dehydrogenase
MTSIALLGDEEQKQRWLPAMARMEQIGAFGLTEPEHGSDAVALETRARRDGDHWVLDGAKRWIGNASFADLVIVWARDDDGKVGGFVVEKGTPGYAASVMAGKTAKRAVWQAEITLDGVRVPAGNRLAHSRGFGDTARVLTATRSGVAWEAAGHALAAYEAALTYVTDREQFGTPLASFQLVQYRLAKMLAEVTTMQLLCLRLAQLTDAGEMTAGMASLAKMNNAAKARQVVADARDILGGNGILLENHVARHHADMEAVYTYEGTDAIQSLIVGREITGESAVHEPAEPPPGLADLLQHGQGGRGLVAAADGRDHLPARAGAGQGAHGQVVAGHGQGQAGQEGDPGPGGHHPLGGVVVVGREVDA